MKQKAYRRKRKQAVKRLLGFTLSVAITIGFIALFFRADAIEQGYKGEEVDAKNAITTQEAPAPTPAATIEPEQETEETLLAAELEDVVDQTAAQYNLDPALVRAVIYVESRGVETADNGLCYGLMQINRDYEDAFCKGAYVENITDPANNIKAGCWFLADLLQWADGNEDLALMAYNLGQTKAKAWWNDGVRSTKYTKSVQTAKEWYK